MQAASKRAASGAHASTSGRFALTELQQRASSQTPKAAPLSWKSSFLPKTPPFLLKPGRSCLQESRRFCRAFVNKQEDGTARGTARQRERRQRHARCPKPFPGISTAAKYVQNDAIILDERARNDLSLLQRGFVQLDTKARQDVALLGSRFHGHVALPLDTRAKADARRLRHIALGLEASLAIAGKEHWSDGGLEADLRLADLRARRRMMEDAYAAATSVRAIQEGLTRLILAKSTAKNGPSNRKRGRRLSTAEQAAEVQAAYLEVVGTLTREADEPAAEDGEELALIVAALLDLDEADGGHGAELVTQASQSPDTATRRALADALAAAPSLWAVGNAGISALERLSGDRNKLVARAASSALRSLKEKGGAGASDDLLYLSFEAWGRKEDDDEKDNRENFDQGDL